MIWLDNDTVLLEEHQVMWEIAEMYHALKLQLAEKFRYDRVSYTNGKAEMIEILLEEANCWRENQTLN